MENRKIYYLVEVSDLADVIPKEWRTTALIICVLMQFIFCVCPARASGIEDTKLFQRVKVPYARESCPEALASRKLVCCKA